MKQLLLQTSPNAALFLSRQIPITALTQQSGDIISIASGSMTAKWRQAGLLLREIPIAIMICWGLGPFAVMLYLSSLQRVLFETNSRKLFFQQKGITCTGQIGSQVPRGRKKSRKEVLS